MEGSVEAMLEEGGQAAGSQPTLALAAAAAPEIYALLTRLLLTDRHIRSSWDGPREQ